jgi:hypothetical protein
MAASMAASTLAENLCVPLMYFDTVAMDTWEAAATSRRVGAVFFMTRILLLKKAS